MSLHRSSTCLSRELHGGYGRRSTVPIVPRRTRARGGSSAPLSSRSLQRYEIRHEVIERGWFEPLPKTRHRRSSVVRRELRQFLLEVGVEGPAGIAELNRKRVFVDADA